MKRFESDEKMTTYEAAEADDDAKFIQELCDELEARPAIACPVKYTGPGSEAAVNQAVVRYKVQAQLLKRRHPWLDFSALESVVFHQDYALALREVSELAGHECKATSEEGGIGLAMVVHVGEKCVVVLDAGIAHGLMEEADPSTQDLCLDTALHELCHVDDYSRKRRLLGLGVDAPQIAPIHRYVFTAADAAWSEYFANKYSHSAASSPDMSPKFIAEVVPSVVRQVRQAIIEYRTHSRLEQLLQLCAQKLRYLFQAFGYAAGRLAASGSDLKSVAPESVDVLRAAGLEDVWQSVFDELERLDACRESWTSFAVYEPLMNQAGAAVRTFGIRYYASGDGVGVDIPYTPETMPDTPFAQFVARLAT